MSQSIILHKENGGGFTDFVERNTFHFANISTSNAYQSCITLCSSRYSCHKKGVWIYGSQQLLKMLKAVTKAAREAIEKESGVRYSILIVYDFILLTQCIICCLVPRNTS